jgi:uncharacterized membrane protein YczE
MSNLLGPLEQLRAGRLARRLPQLYAGLVLYGITAACLIRSRLGNAPWDVLHQGIAGHLGVSIGTVSIAVSVVVLLAWIPLRELPGLGTLSNAAIVGLAVNLGLAILPEPHAMAGRIGLTVAGVAGNAVATAMYIGARFGAGPRDGLMTGLHRRTGRPIWLVRTSIEVSVVILGLLLGGDFGVGTLLYAASIGPLVQRLLPLFTVATARGGAASGPAGHHGVNGDEMTALGVAGRGAPVGDGNQAGRDQVQARDEIGDLRTGAGGDRLPGHQHVPQVSRPLQLRVQIARQVVDRDVTARRHGLRQ